MVHKFKVGDIVEVDYQSKRNRDYSYPTDTVYYEVIEVYLKGKSKTPFVRFKGNYPSYFQERFKLAKNAIVRDIIKDL